MNPTRRSTRRSRVLTRAPLAPCPACLCGQNNAANAFNGDYRNSSVGTTRTAQEQHPFHLHGHRFWGEPPCMARLWGRSVEV